MRTAKYIMEKSIVDPDTGYMVEITIFKHNSGKMLALDSHFVDHTIKDAPLILDPYFTGREAESTEEAENLCELVFPNTGKVVITPEEIIEFNRIKKSLNLSNEEIDSIVKLIGKWSRIIDLAPRHQSMLNYIKDRSE